MSAMHSACAHASPSPRVRALAEARARVCGRGTRRRGAPRVKSAFDASPSRTVPLGVMSIRIKRGLDIPEKEVTYRFARSGGPGGQKVNKVSTRVTLLFDVGASQSLSDAQRERIRRRLATRINKAGVLQVVSQSYRTQAANRREVRERFAELLREALKRMRRRKPTRIPDGAKEERLKDKKHRSRLKRERARSHHVDD